MAAKAPTAYLPGYKDVKHHELRTAETDASYLLPTLQSMVANNPNLTLLDIGAGSGTITASLAKYLPRGEVTALDLSEEILKQASAYAKEKGINNIRFQTANVNNLPFADNTFDVVHTSQMLCYQSAPADSLREMLRVLKPGGVVAVRECDMRMWSYYPELPALKKFHQIQIATHAAAGGSNVIGPQLVSLALKAGARREQCEMSMGCWCYAERRERMVWGEY